MNLDDENDVIDSLDDEIQYPEKQEEKLQKNLEKTDMKISLNLESIEDVLNAFKYATSKLENAQNQLQNVDIANNILRIKEIIENGNKNVVEALEIEIKSLAKEDVNFDLNRLDNLVFELESSKLDIKEAAKSRSKMLTISILLTSLIVGVIAFGIGFLIKEMSIENAIKKHNENLQANYFFYKKDNWQIKGKTIAGAIILNPIKE